MTKRVKFDSDRHIFIEDLAVMLGMDVSQVPGALGHEGAPGSVGRVVIDGRRRRFYDRAEFEAWTRRGKSVREEGEIVPSRSAPKFTPLRLSDELKANLVRSAEVYPRGLPAMSRISASGG